MTQRELAQKSGVHYVQIAQLETKKRDMRKVSLNTVLRLCDALHVSNPKKLLEPDVLPKPERKPSKPRKPREPRVTLQDMDTDEIGLLMDENPDDLIDDMGGSQE